MEDFARDFKIPAGYVVREIRNDGMALYSEQKRLSVIISMAEEEDGKKWVHLSMAHKSKLPTWATLKRVKKEFFGKLEAIQVFPDESKSSRVNCHPYCLHLWHCMDGSALPDFTRGGETHMKAINNGPSLEVGGG